MSVDARAELGARGLVRDGPKRVRRKSADPARDDDAAKLRAHLGEALRQRRRRSVVDHVANKVERRHDGLDGHGQEDLAGRLGGARREVEVRRDARGEQRWEREDYAHADDVSDAPCRKGERRHAPGRARAEKFCERRVFPKAQSRVAAEDGCGFCFRLGLLCAGLVRTARVVRRIRPCIQSPDDSKFAAAQRLHGVARELREGEEERGPQLRSAGRSLGHCLVHRGHDRRHARARCSRR
mmetsp:Transcript_2819/g.8287  ORF Transcript_2819/g.8287 Transcript_2819/m.8287 type:complete len:240 (+) Transcript_2819:79-798(+)